MRIIVEDGESLEAAMTAIASMAGIKEKKPKTIKGNYIEAIPAMTPEEAVDILDEFLSDCVMGYVTKCDGSDLDHDILEALYTGIYALRHSEQ